MERGWKDMDTLPKEARRVLVWHVYNGFMVCGAMTARKNRYNVYWQELPDTWIDPRERLPKREDADAQQCILIVDTYGEVRAAGWNQTSAETARAWAPRPDPPDNYRDLRRNAETEDI